MPYDKPTPGELMKRFPEFETIEKPLLQAALDEASRSVDESWAELDYKPGIMYLAAHFLTLAIQQSVGGRISAIGLGSISLQFDRGVRGTLDESISFSVYGDRFNQIRARNCIGPLVI
jgi:hypothetical protein